MITLPKNKKILFFCAHPDDDVFSSAATIYVLKKNKNKITSVYLTNSPRGVSQNISTEEKIAIRKGEGTNACRVLGIRPIFLDLDRPVLRICKENIAIVVKLLKKERPDIIFVLPPNDAHPTHRKTNRIVTKALKSFKVEQKWFYETWTPLAKPNFIFFFGEKLMKIKIKAAKAHKSQIERGDFIGSTVALNVFRGISGPEMVSGGWGKKHKSEKYGEAFLVSK